MKIQASIASSAFPPLLCALLVSTSVCARRHSGGTAFVRRNTATPLSSLSSLSPPPVSALDTSAFSSERDVQIAASLLVATAALCRGGYQSAEYYDDRGYNGNDDDYYSKQYGDDSNYNYEDNYPYDDRDSSYDDREKSSRFGGSSFSMPDIIRTGNRKIGLPMLAIGGALTILGASLFFNKTLMRLGNLFFVAGVPMTLGPGRTAGYFFQPKKARATGCLAAGVVLVFVGWPILGIVLEAFGFLNLFGNMFPMAMMIMKQMPVIGPLLKGNAGKKNSDNNRFGGGGRGDTDRYDDYDDRDRYDYNDSLYGYDDDDDNNRYY
mmetsp:Transcript_4999/g.11949  ORF Transcript_4999/g.11949 Transcript_4999/m.11949 type:complete len:322 (+) Transcript_4999:265-1230(+)